jgi:hypothetical protein
MENCELSKQISIQGLTNRYQIKKLMGHKPIPKKRVVTNNWDFPPEFFEKTVQLKHLNEIHTNCKKEKIHQIMLSQILTKVNSYKHQDVLKEKEGNLIKPDEVVEKLLSSKLLCSYCETDVYVLYEHAREMTQWTLDRMNNNIGHDSDNVVISCLECNLKRRRQNMDNFLFTKQMKIIRS